jgi:hypothetical protein
MGGPKQAWDNTDLLGPWLKGMRNSMNAQIWSFKKPNFLSVSATRNGLMAWSVISAHASALSRRCTFGAPRSSSPAGPVVHAAFEELGRQKVGALIVGSDPSYLSRREQIIALTARHAIPAVYELRQFVDAGGLNPNGSSPGSAGEAAKV